VTKLLDNIELPSGLRSCSLSELEQISSELREELIDCMSSSSGHFASSLGVTELTVALHHSLETPHDRVIFDVGHQGYIHKMLTGRRERLHTIRQKGGLSGFLKRNESEFDAFGAGHAGTSISAGVGMAAALARTNPERFVVPVIGDGSITSGMAFEALNHAGSLGLKNLIVIVNDNEMSISPNVGAMSWLFSKAVTSKTSTSARSLFKDLYKKGYVPEIVYRAIDRAEEAAQGFFAGPAMLFESFGFRYIGPVDGHNIGDMITALEHAKQQDVPVVIHAYTEKGKGYKPAEADPIKWHAVKPFDKERGEFLSGPPKKTPPTYTEVFADALIEQARADQSVVGITAAMATGTGLNKLEAELPEQFFDVAICEQHAVTFAAGLACEGYKPVCAIYSTFLQRAYDQVLHDVCIQNLPVIFAMDRAGVVGNDGETHQGAFDVSYLRSMPNMTIMAPRDENSLRHMLHTSLQHDGPIALRYPRGNGEGVALDSTLQTIPIGRSEVLQRGEEVLFLCLGPTVSTASRAAEQLLQDCGVSSTVVDARFAKPLDEEMLAREVPAHRLVCTLEDHTIVGGFGSAVLESVERLGLKREGKIFRFGIQDNFVPHASQEEQREMNGFDARGIVRFLTEQLDIKKVVAFR
jgi:1-deoxy-D-xylulose-5-phosphate synthase